MSKARPVQSKVVTKPIPAANGENKRSVAKLRPKAPITTSDGCNILEIAMKMRVGPTRGSAAYATFYLYFYYTISGAKNYKELSVIP